MITDFTMWSATDKLMCSDANTTHIEAEKKNQKRKEVSVPMKQ